jgi:hypothetical protein
MEKNQNIPKKFRNGMFRVMFNEIGLKEQDSPILIKKILSEGIRFPFHRGIKRELKVPIQLGKFHRRMLRSMLIKIVLKEQDNPILSNLSLHVRKREPLLEGCLCQRGDYLPLRHQKDKLFKITVDQ